MVVLFEKVLIILVGAISEKVLSNFFQIYMFYCPMSLFILISVIVWYKRPTYCTHIQAAPTRT